MLFILTYDYNTHTLLILIIPSNPVTVPTTIHFRSPPIFSAPEASWLELPGPVGTENSVNPGTSVDVDSSLPFPAPPPVAMARRVLEVVSAEYVLV